MRHIQKLDTPDFFLEDTNALTHWGRYKEKKKLKKYILENEQNYLCCYCESKVAISGEQERDGTHLEHIKPKKVYTDLTFSYQNLVVSCQGTCYNEEGDNGRHSCGHKKEDEYSEEKFLNPTTVEDIRDYFRYETVENERITILPTDKSPLKAQYMIDILYLNDERLSKARFTALKDFEEFGMMLEYDEVEALLSEDLAFISTLRYEYGV